jgi:hypothetical protein
MSSIYEQDLAENWDSRPNGDEPPDDWKSELPDDDLEDIPLLPETAHPAMRAEAFHGIAGEFVRLVLPETEADESAILVQFLVMVGNLVGRRPHARVGATSHFLNEFAVVVGATSSGRKGTGGDLVRYVLEHVDPAWVTGRIMEGGLASGEGLVFQVRDPVVRREPIKDRGKALEYVEVVVDAGEPDKRLCVSEGEFAAVLRVSKKEGNILSVNLRHAWDGKNLRNASKNSPLRATAPHISINAHITLAELKQTLAETENWNGFSNRFLWLVSRRSKLLPDGGRLPDLTSIVERLKAVVEFAQGCGELRRDTDASGLWRRLYIEHASRFRPGALAGVLGRAEAHMLRLSCIYAILDHSPCVRVEHVRAAAAVWDCCEASTSIIFGDVAGSSVEEKVLRIIRENPGCTRTYITRSLSNHITGCRLVAAIGTLRTAGLVRIEEGRCPKTNRRVDHHYAAELPVAAGPCSQIRSFAAHSERSPVSADDEELRI